MFGFRLYNKKVLSSCSKKSKSAKRLFVCLFLFSYIDKGNIKVKLPFTYLGQNHMGKRGLVFLIKTILIYS